MRPYGKFELVIILMACLTTGCDMQTKFSHQIAHADRVVVTKSANGTPRRKSKGPCFIESRKTVLACLLATLFPLTTRMITRQGTMK